MDVYVLVILALVALVKSDVGVGYRYQVPVTSYDAPAGSIGNLNDRKYYQVQKQHFPTGSISPGLVGPSAGLQTPIHEHSSFLASKNGVDNTNFVSGSLQSTPNLQNLGTAPNREDISTFNLLGSPVNRNTANAQKIKLDQRNNFDTESSEAKFTASNQNVVSDSRSSFASGGSQQEVEKHLYFYSAPEEPEEIRSRFAAPVPAPKKNVKIIFIKTPTFNAAPIDVPVVPQNEDKTIVYVLVKKPDASSIVLPTPIPTKPSKPEVYFIKYNSQKEAQEAVTNIQQGGTIANTISANTGYNADQDIQSQFNLRSRSSAEISGSGISQAPVVVSTTAAPSSLNVVGQTVFGDNAQESPSTERTFSSGTNVDGSLESRAQFGSSTTLSSLIGPTVSSKGSDGFNVHQVYNSPTVTNRGSDDIQVPTVTNRGSEDIQVHQVYGPPRT